jgi:hypothetical protein
VTHILRDPGRADHQKQLNSFSVRRIEGAQSTDAQGCWVALRITRAPSREPVAIAAIKYRSLEDLLADVPITEEDPPTAKIIKRLNHVKPDGELSRGEFLDICHWKSPRSLRLCERNSARFIEKMSHQVFATQDERIRLHLLTGLQGVSVPTASAILTLTDPKHYGVIDIRVWQLLHKLQSVTTNPRGQAFTFNHWDLYLTILRHHAKRLKVAVRLVELTLFQFHRDHQTGSVY